MKDLAPELESFDVVTVRPRSDRAMAIDTTPPPPLPPPAVTTAQPGRGDTSPEEVQPALCSSSKTVGDSTVLTRRADPEGAGKGADGGTEGKRGEEVEGDGTEDAAAAAAASEASPGNMSITVRMTLEGLACLALFIPLSVDLMRLRSRTRECLPSQRAIFCFVVPVLRETRGVGHLSSATRPLSSSGLLAMNRVSHAPS